MTTTELKKSHPLRLVGEAQMRNGQSYTHVWWVKIWEGYLGTKESEPHTRLPSPWFQCQEDKSVQLLATKTSGDRVGKRNFWSSKQFLLKNLHMDSPTQTHSL